MYLFAEGNRLGTGWKELVAGGLKKDMPAHSDRTCSFSGSLFNGVVVRAPHHHPCVLGRYSCIMLQDALYSSQIIVYKFAFQVKSMFIHIYV